jgi:Yip1 domain
MAAAPVLPASPEPVPQPTALSQGARIIDTFIAPSKTFTDIRRSAQWWAPFLLMVVMSTIFVYTAGQKIGFQKIVENQMQSQPKAQDRFEKMTPEQRAGQVKWTGILSYVFIPLFTLIIWLIMAGLQFATFKFGANADLTFSRSLAVVVYGGLPFLLRQVLAVVSVLAGVNPDGFSLQNPFASNPGYFMNPADGPFLYNLASSLDVFLIWTLVVTAIGFAYAGKVKQGTSYAIVFGWWIVITVGFSALGAAFS